MINQTLNYNDRYTANAKTQTLTQEGKFNVETMKRNMSEKKTSLLSLSGTRSETEKVNDLLTNIPTNNITDLNDLIYAGAKLVCEKSGSPEDHRQKVKTRVGTQIRFADEKTKTTSKNTKTEHENIFGRSRND